MGERTLVALIGAIAGVLFCCVSSLFLLAAARTPAVESSAPPPAALIEADITEAYLNRTFLDNAGAGFSGYTITDGRLDVLPGSRMDFDVRVAAPIGTVGAHGTVTLKAERGRLAIHLAGLRLGQIPIGPMVALALPRLDDDISRYANDLLVERTAKANVRLIAVRSDDTRLQFYFEGVEGAP